MHIAIVGCGIAGQAAAIALARDGHDVTVVERFAAARPLGAGLLLQPTGLAALERLGLRASVEAIGAAVAHLDGRTVEGRRILDLPYAESTYGIGIHRAGLFAILHASMLQSGVELVLGYETVSIGHTERPCLIDATGKKLGPFDLVVVCSGAHDGLRASLGLTVRAPLYPWGALWAGCADRGGAFSNRLQQRYDGAHLMIGILPIGHAPDAASRHVAFFWSLRLDDFEAQKTAGLAALKSRVLTAWPEAEPILDEITDWDALSLATYRDVFVRPCRKGRVVVIGDAAHGTSPQLGQGANLALIDAVTLAHCLRRGGDVAPALARFEKMRRVHIAFYRLASRALTPAYQSDSRFAAWLRDAVMARAQYLPVVRELMQATLSGQMKWPYGRWRLPD